MTDDSWRRGRDDDFGPPLFGDDPTDEVQAVDLSFGDGSGSLPHWTEPATGEVPRLGASRAEPDATDDVDVWSSFSGSQPVWRDDPAEAADPSGGLFDDLSGALDVPIGHVDALDDSFVSDASAPLPRQGRITIGTDPTEDGSRPVGRKQRPGERGRPARSGTPARPGAGQPGAPATGGVGGRNMPVAIGVGLGMAAIFVLALATKPWAVLTIIAAVLGLAAVEFFDKVAEKGYQPSFIVGITAIVSLPVAAYYAGERALGLVVVFAFLAAAITFIAQPSVESSPLANMAITTLAVVWIGVMGTYAILILNYSNDAGVRFFFGDTVGTDTLFLVALGIVANDVGALFVGSAVGKSPLRPWISPSKSWQGLFGGAFATLLAMWLVDLSGKSTTWNSIGDLMLLGAVIAICAPLGDLTESMFKRNLDVKDFGTMVAGHGGILDRFDGFLFTLPAAYYLLVVLEPFVS